MMQQYIAIQPPKRMCTLQTFTMFLWPETFAKFVAECHCLPHASTYYIQHLPPSLWAVDDTVASDNKDGDTVPLFAPQCEAPCTMPLVVPHLHWCRRRGSRGGGYAVLTSLSHRAWGACCRLRVGYGYLGLCVLSCNFPTGVRTTMQFRATYSAAHCRESPADLECGIARQNDLSTPIARIPDHTAGHTTGQHMPSANTASLET